MPHINHASCSFRYIWEHKTYLSKFCCRWLHFPSTSFNFSIVSSLLLRVTASSFSSIEFFIDNDSTRFCGMQKIWFSKSIIKVYVPLERLIQVERKQNMLPTRLTTLGIQNKTLGTMLLRKIYILPSLRI